MTEPNDYLAAYRRSVSTPAGVRGRNLQAVLERAGRIHALEEPQRPRRAASALVLKITTIAVLTAGAGWGAMRAFSSPVPAGRPHVADAVRAPVVSAAAPAPSVPPLPAVRPARVSAEPSAPAPPATVRAPSKTSSTPTAETAADRLREEVALLELARTHLDTGRLDDARSALRRHARLFPHGTLAEERSAWSAIVSCSRGGTQPTAAARSFLLTHGGTPLAARVKAECGL